MGGSRIKIFTATSPEEVEALGEKWAKEFPSDAIVALYGDLGAGKTTFVRGLARGLGLSAEAVSSPTFVYLNIYQRSGLSIFHFDLWRLKGEEDFLAAGFDEILEGPGLKCIEWAERIPSLLPKEAIKITFRYTGERDRTLEVGGSW